MFEIDLMIVSASSHGQGAADFHRSLQKIQGANARLFICNLFRTRKQVFSVTLDRWKIEILLLSSENVNDFHRFPLCNFQRIH